MEVAERVVYRVLAEKVLRAGVGIELAVEGRAYGFGDVFACKASANGPVSRVENNRRDLVYVQVLAVDCNGGGRDPYLQRTRQPRARSKNSEYSWRTALTGGGAG